jgi:hypothetical protein
VGDCLELRLKWEIAWNCASIRFSATAFTVLYFDALLLLVLFAPTPGVEEAPHDIPPLDNQLILELERRIGAAEFVEINPCCVRRYQALPVN